MRREKSKIFPIYQLIAAGKCECASELASQLLHVIRKHVTHDFMYLFYFLTCDWQPLFHLLNYSK